MTQDSSHHPSGSDKVKRYGWKLTGDPGRFMMIHKDQITIPEDSYQRAAAGGAADSKVLRIASNFNWVAFQVISVAERNGVFYAVDGGHRLRAARRRSDIEMVPCMVYNMASEKEEAVAFDAVNSNRKPMTAVDRHRAFLVSGENIAQVVEKYAESGGRVISKNAGPGTLTCVNDLRKSIKEDEDALSLVWPVVVDLCRGRSMPHSLLGGLFYLQRFCSESPSSQRVRKKILFIGYDEMAKSAQAGAAFHGSRTPKSFADGMLKVINKGFQKKLEIER